jgi:SAM-dependent methyltransferase
MSSLWKDFFDNYRRCEVVTQADLFLQVGKTINKQPIPEGTHRKLIDRIALTLQLCPKDHLLDLCCGNGLVSYELATYVGQLTGIDFAEHMIRAARQFKMRQNTSYHVGDVTMPLSTFVGENVFPNKILMNVGLAYFEPLELDTILANIWSHLGDRPFLALFTDIPNFDLKWNFYNTPERRARHLENERKRDNTNDGLGRWWRAAEIEEIGSNHGLKVQVINQPPDLSNYRMDALISSPSQWNGKVAHGAGREKP